MPTYGYQCTECKHEFSVFQAMKDDPIEICPECSGKVTRLLYPVGVVFKGSGWYVTDSRKPEKSESGDTDKPKADGDKSAPETNSASADSKPADKAAAASPAASSSNTDK